MNYKSRSHFIIFLPFALICVPLLLKDFEWVNFIFLIFLITVSLLKYKFIIHENTLYYEIRILPIKIYSKTIYIGDIKKVHFKRANLFAKMAIIKVKKGFPIRIAFFNPEDVYENLEKFCTHHSIQIEKTKDYKLIEQMNK